MEKLSIAAHKRRGCNAPDLCGRVPVDDLVPSEPEPGIRRLRALPGTALARAQHPAWIAMAADNYWRVKVRWVTPLGAGHRLYPVALFERAEAWHRNAFQN